MRRIAGLKKQNNNKKNQIGMTSTDTTELDYVWEPRLNKNKSKSKTVHKKEKERGEGWAEKKEMEKA